MNPRPGDQIFFYGGGTIGHTGIITSVSDSTVTVVEGNSSDRVQKLTYRLGDSRIAGYGHPWYEKAVSTEPVIANQYEDWCGMCDEGAIQSNPPLSTPSAQTCVVRLPLLKRGATGIAVESAQLLLIHRGYDCGGRKLLGRETPDGEYGPVTEQAVKDLQRSMELEADGEIGGDTWTALLTE